MIENAWVKWTAATAGFKIFTKTVSKFVGVACQNAPQVFIATAASGFIQILLGLTLLKLNNDSLEVRSRTIIGSALYGIGVFSFNALMFYTYTVGGDLGVVSFIITLQIIPEALLDRIRYRNKITARQWLGFAVSIGAAYAILGTPGSGETQGLPLWVFCAFGLVFVNTGNQVITKEFSDINVFSRNVWGGLTIVTCSLVAFMIFGESFAATLSSEHVQKVIALAMAIGFGEVGIWVTSQLSFRKGAPLAARGFIMNGIVLPVVMLIGIVIFGEEATVGKAVGVVAYFVAYRIIRG